MGIPAIAPVDQGNLSHRVYYALREALTEGAFNPGERIMAQDLATRLKTSITPVREACLRLVSERGLELRSGRFLMVPELSHGRYLEIRTIRLALEGLAAELAAANAQEAEVEHLANVQKEFEAARDKKDFPTENRLNRDFHLGVYRLSHMSLLIDHIESLWVSMGPILKIYHEEINVDASIANHHWALLQALKAGDGAQARNAVMQDLLEGGEGILRYLRSR